jgi:hypothetical protein
MFSAFVESKLADRHKISSTITNREIFRKKYGIFIKDLMFLFTKRKALLALLNY